MATLRDTADPELWAEEFVRIFDGHVICGYDGHDEDDPCLSIEVMTEWFATAMQTALDLDKAERRRVKREFLEPPDAEPKTLMEVLQEDRDDDLIVTKTGKVLTDEDIQALADEAEQGYDVSKFREGFDEGRSE